MPAVMFPGIDSTNPPLESMTTVPVPETPVLEVTVGEVEGTTTVSGKPLGSVLPNKRPGESIFK